MIGNKAECTKILHIIYSGAIGGGPVVVENLVYEFEKLGYKNTVISDDDGPLLGKLSKLEVCTKNLPLSTKRRFLLNIPRLIITIRKVRPKVVILYGQYAGTFGGFASKLAGCNNIIYSAQFPSFLTDFSLPKKIRNYIAEKASCYFASRIVCVSSSDKEEYIRRKIVKQTKMSLIFNGIMKVYEDKIELGDHINLPKGKIIGFVGRLSDQKGVFMLIKAIKPILSANNEIYLVIVGDGPLREDLETKIKFCGLESKVYFLGFRNDIISIMKEFDLLVIPSLFEPFGIVALEGMVAGIPIIASNVGGLKDTITDNVNGLLFSPGNEKDLRDKINYLLSKPEVCAEFVKKGNSIVRNKFSSYTMAKLYLKEIENILNSKNRIMHGTIS